MTFSAAKSALAFNRLVAIIFDKAVRSYNVICNQAFPPILLKSVRVLYNIPVSIEFATRQ